WSWASISFMKSSFPRSFDAVPVVDGLFVVAEKMDVPFGVVLLTSPTVLTLFGSPPERRALRPVIDWSARAGRRERLGEVAFTSGRRWRLNSALPWPASRLT